MHTRCAQVSLEIKGVKLFSGSELAERLCRQPTDLKKICTRIVKDFLEIKALFRLESVYIATGYDFMKYVQSKYHVSIGAGRAYSTLQALERQGYVKGEQKSTKRIYSITPEGQAQIRTVTKNLDFIMALVVSLLSH